MSPVVSDVSSFLIPTSILMTLNIVVLKVFKSLELYLINVIIIVWINKSKIGGGGKGHKVDSVGFSNLNLTMVVLSPT